MGEAAAASLVEPAGGGAAAFGRFSQVVAARFRGGRFRPQQFLLLRGEQVGVERSQFGEGVVGVPLGGVVGGEARGFVQGPVVDSGV